jgi:hypothetical protein
VAKVPYECINTTCVYVCMCVYSLVHSFMPVENILIAFVDIVTRNCHFPAPSRNCMTHPQVRQDFPDMSHVPLHKKTIKQTLARTHSWLPQANVLSTNHDLLFCHQTPFQSHQSIVCSVGSCWVLLKPRVRSFSSLIWAKNNCQF